MIFDMSIRGYDMDTCRKYAIPLVWDNSERSKLLDKYERRFKQQVLERPEWYRLMLTAASLERPFLEEVVGDSARFLAISNRRFPLERIVAAPQEFSEVLDICADFVRAAVRNGGGNILVFLPGFDAILRLQSMLRQLMEPRDGRYQAQRLHSDALGLEEDEQKPEEADDRCTLVVLSSVIAARGVTLPDIRYVFIHPYCRRTLLHQSGCEV